MARQAGHPNIIYCVGNIVSRSCHAASTHIFLLVENNMSVGSRHPSVEKLDLVAFKPYFMELGGGLAGTGYRIYIQIILYSDPAGTARISFLASCWKLTFVCLPRANLKVYRGTLLYYCMCKHSRIKATTCTTREPLLRSTISTSFFLLKGQGDELSLPEFLYHRFRRKPVMVITKLGHEFSYKARRSAGRHGWHMWENACITHHQDAWHDHIDRLSHLEASSDLIDSDSNLNLWARYRARADGAEGRRQASAHSLTCMLHEIASNLWLIAWSDHAIDSTARPQYF